MSTSNPTPKEIKQMLAKNDLILKKKLKKIDETAQSIESRLTKDPSLYNKEITSAITGQAIVVGTVGAAAYLISKHLIKKKSRRRK